MNIDPQLLVIWAALLFTTALWLGGLVVLRNTRPDIQKAHRERNAAIIAKGEAEAKARLYSRRYEEACKSRIRIERELPFFATVRVSLEAGGVDDWKTRQDILEMAMEQLKRQAGW